MKKLFTILFALVATTALWAEDFEVNGIYYTILTDKTNEVEVTDGYPYYTGSVTIPSSVTYNGTTYSVTSIGDYAFYLCDGLTSVTIPNSVTSIGEMAFAGCSGLTSITIPNSVTSIGEMVFYWCYGLTSVVWNAKNCADFSYSYYAPFYIIFSQITSFTFGESVEHIPANLCSQMDNLTSITIPNSVTSIGEYAFFYCKGLTSITIPNSVTSIGRGAFADCDGLTSVTIPNSVKSIGERAFYWCSKLTSITIPNSVTSIGSYAFFNCDGLTSITIPNSVTSIGLGAFSGCRSLTSIIVEDANSTYDSRENCNAIIETTTNTLIAGCQNTIIPNSVTSIGDWAFSGCSGLTSITIPNSVTSIGEGAFADCYGLTSITIPNSVTEIEYSTFWGCFGLTSVTIPNSVTSIGEDAFYNCYGLTSITSLAEIPPTLGTDVFYKVSNNIPVYVPYGSVSAYQSAEGWKDFTNIQCMPEDESAVDNVHSQSTNVQKFFRDGQLLIIRDGKTYNAQGVEL